MADYVPAKTLKYQKMSDHIPFEIQADIMKRLPIKSLLRFRSVSKPWKSLIGSSEFVTNYNAPQSQPQRIFVSYVDSEGSEEKYVSIVDDNTFPSNKFFHEAPVSVNKLNSPFHHPKLIGSSQGLFCFYRYNGKPKKRKSTHGTAVIWNPSVRRSVVISVPNKFGEECQTVVTFAVCPLTKDPKLVKITFVTDCTMSWQVEIYTLRSSVWRTPICSNLPFKTMELTGDREVIDGFIYFLSTDWVIEASQDDYNYLIMSFDMISEEFTKINLPDCLSRGLDTALTMSKLRESLVLLAYDRRGDVKKVFDVWIMEQGVPKSFTKLFTIDPPHGSIERVIGFRKSGEAITEMKNDSDNFDDSDDSQYSLCVYDPYSQHMDNTGISGKAYSFFANSYVETLLLLVEDNDNDNIAKCGVKNI